MRATIACLFSVLACRGPAHAQDAPVDGMTASPPSIVAAIDLQHAFDRFATPDHLHFRRSIERSRRAAAGNSVSIGVMQSHVGRIAAARADRQVHERRRFSRTVMIGAFVGAAALAGIAVKYNFEADAAYIDAESAHGSYEQAFTTAEVEHWRSEIERANRRGNDAETTRNILYAASAALYFAGIMIMLQ